MRIAMLRTLHVFVLVMVSCLLVAPTNPVAASQAFTPPVFHEVAPQGFGDRHNSAAWSMQWWQGKLYVGTVRSWYCWSQALLHYDFPGLFPYPPTDPDMDCAPDPQDLPLQAEIWRWTPETATLERVFQSPMSMPIPDKPGKFIAREIGFRGMTIFQEPDGTEALYVGSVFPINLNPEGALPPRILRSTDGIHFEAVPQEPGTVLGDVDKPSIRGFTVYKGRLYTVIGSIQGAGPLYEAKDPAGGNDNFRQVSPPDMQVFEKTIFNGYLYVGTYDPLPIINNGDGREWLTGYQVLKTEATGTPPYTFVPVVTDGGFLEPKPSRCAVSMHVYRNRLYVGTDTPAEIIRINPDDTWDLVIGKPRNTPDGWKYPLSGLNAGFNWPFNVHIWRMQKHGGVLYAGTADQSTRFRNFPKLGPLIEKWLGFDLFSTSSGGWYWRPIVTDGLGDKFQMGIRTFASTPCGLFFGTASFWYGLRIWQGVSGGDLTSWFPLANRSYQGSEMGNRSTMPLRYPDHDQDVFFSEPPERLEVETQQGRAVLSWERPDCARWYRIFRSVLTVNRDLQIPRLARDAWIPGEFIEVGETAKAFFVDTTVQTDKQYQYYVVAQDAAGGVSQPSNLVLAPSLAAVVTFQSLADSIDKWVGGNGFKAQDVLREINERLSEAQLLVRLGDLQGASDRMEQLRMTVRKSEMASFWFAEDLEILIGKLVRRLGLVRTGLVDLSHLI